MALSFEDASAFLPKYLSPGGRRDLFAELSRLPETHSYYATNSLGELLQGDGWESVDFFDIEAGAQSQIKVVVLSNTCDVASENPRNIPIRVTVSPLIRVRRLISLLQHHGVSDAEVDEKLRTIRRQEISNIFYFPKSATVDDEYVVFFDNVQSQLPTTFMGNTGKHRIFSLNQAGFWYFLLKLSIHFCRANEGVIRGSGQQA